MMTGSKIQMIKSKLDIDIPDSYQQQLLNHPFEKSNVHDVIKHRFLSDADEIIKINNEIRKMGFKNTDWPKHYLIIGKSGKNNFYFINIKNTDEKIYLADENKKFNPKAIGSLLYHDTYEEFIKRLLILQENLLVE